ncbi:MAG: rhodanese-like domain-containing protein [Caldilineaceae bacterium]
MKRQLSMYLLTIILLSLSGCGGTTAPAGVDSAAAGDTAATAIDLSTLPAVIDAQTAAAIMDRADVLLIDVREQSEYDAGHIPGITLIPMNSVPSRLSEIPTDKTVVLACRSGNRSGQVFDYLKAQGYTNIHNLQGGITAWQNAGLPVER